MKNKARRVFDNSNLKDLMDIGINKHIFSSSIGEVEIINWYLSLIESNNQLILLKFIGYEYKMDYDTSELECVEYSDYVISSNIKSAILFYNENCTCNIYKEPAELEYIFDSKNECWLKYCVEFENGMCAYEKIIKNNYESAYFKKHQSFNVSDFESQYSSMSTFLDREMPYLKHEVVIV